MTSVKRRVKSILEDTFGISISRGGPQQPPNKHSDAELRRLRNWASTDVVFDVGANDGRTILRIQDQLASPKIYAFEPVAATFNKLVESTKHLPNVQCFQKALGAAPRHQDIYVNAIDAMSSFSPNWGEAVAKERVEISTVDTMMEKLGLEFIHYLKIDTEGSELEVLKGAADALRQSRIAIIQAEVGFGQTHHEFITLEQLRQYLSPLGYALYGIYNQCRARAKEPEVVNPDWVPTAAGVLVYCDALFIRADL